MANTAADIQKLYIAYFNRPADPLGLAYWMQSSFTINQIAASFADSAEYKAAYATLDTANTVNKVYQNIFGHAADLPGLTYWVGQINTGKVTIAGAAISILGGATGADKVAIDSKLAASTSFTAAIDTTAETLAYSGSAAMASSTAKTWLSTVVDATTLTAAQATVDATILSITSAPVVGQTFTLTTSATDIITGTAGNDIIIADLSSGTGISTSQASDVVNGGDGVDTLKVYSFGAGGSGVLPVTVSSVEIIDFVSPGAATAINTTSYTGVTTVRLENADTFASTVTSSSGQGLQLGTSTSAGNTAGITWAAATGTQTLTLSGAKVVTAGLTVNTATGLNIVSNTGTNTVKLVAAAATKLTISGDKTLDLSSAALAAATKTIDASAATGSVKATFGAASSATVTGGAGADTFDVAAVGGNKVVASLGAGNDFLKLGATAFNALSTYDGGAGTDKVQILDGANLSATTGAYFTNFETLSTGAGKGVYLANAIAGITAINVDGAITAATTIDKLTTQTVTVSASLAQNLTLTLKDATGTADMLTVNVGAPSTALTVSKIITSGIETLTFNSTGTSSSAHTISTLDVTGATTLVITGDTKLIASAFANAGTVTKIDASASTGGFTMGAATGATVGAVYLGSSAADTFLGNAKGDTFYGAGGGDTITLGGAGFHDTVVFKAGTDSAIKLSTTGTLVTTGMDTVSTFVSGEDSFDLGTFAFAGTAKSALFNKGAFVAATALLADAAAAGVTGFFNDGVANRGVAIQNDGTDTYIFIDANKDGNFTAGVDAVIKVAGVTTLTLADFGF